MKERITKESIVEIVRARCLWTLKCFLMAVPLLTFESATLKAAVAPLDQNVGGKAYSDWRAEQWIWWAGIPWDGRHPAQDSTGAHALRDQKGPVWFLTGSTSRNPITRRIRIPNDIYLMLGMGVTCSSLEPPPFHGETEEELRMCAESWALEMEHFIRIDDVEVSDLENYKLTTPMFDVFYNPQNGADVPGGGWGKMVASGIGLLLEPFSPGLHTIRFQQQVPSFDVFVDITYEITVYPRPALSIKRPSDISPIEVSWPETPGFVLQTAGQLGPDARWTAANVLSSAVANGIQTVTITNIAPQYFQLHHP